MIVHVLHSHILQGKNLVHFLYKEIVHIYDWARKGYFPKPIFLFLCINAYGTHLKLTHHQYE